MRRRRIVGCVLSVVVTAGCANATSESQRLSAAVETIPIPTARAADGLSASPSLSIPPLAAAFHIAYVDDLNIREGPGMDQPVQTVGPGVPTSGQAIQLDAGQGAWVIDRSDVDGQTWYQIVTEDGFLPGWVSAGPNEMWLRQFDTGTCAASPNDAVANGFLRDRPMHALACYGEGDLAITVYWPTAAEAGYDSPCPFGDAGSKWLLCYEYVNKAGDGTRSLAVFGTTELPDFERGRWWTVTGHLNDARAQACPTITGADRPESAAASVLFCRTRFIADSLEQAPAT